MLSFEEFDRIGKIYYPMVSGDLYAYNKHYKPDPWKYCRTIEVIDNPFIGPDRSIQDVIHRNAYVAALIEAEDKIKMKMIKQAMEL